MKKTIIALLIATISSMSHAERVNIPEAVVLAEELPSLSSDDMKYSQAFRGFLIDANIKFHKIMFALNDHPCVEAGECESIIAYGQLESLTKQLASKIIVGSALLAFVIPAKKGTQRLYESITNDGVLNVAKLSAIGLSGSVAFLYWNDYIESLRTMPKDQQVRVIEELELTRTALSKVDYSVLSNSFGALGLSQLVGINDISSMVQDMKDLQQRIEGLTPGLN